MLDEFALQSGVSRRLNIQIEQAQANPSIGTLLRLAEAFGLTLGALLGEEPAQTYSEEPAQTSPALNAPEKGASCGLARTLSC